MTPTPLTVRDLEEALRTARSTGKVDDQTPVHLIETSGMRNPATALTLMGPSASNRRSLLIR
jgi:hypothetical protein